MNLNILQIFEIFTNFVKIITSGARKKLLTCLNHQLKYYTLYNHPQYIQYHRIHQSQ